MRRSTFTGVYWGRVAATGVTLAVAGGLAGFFFAGDASGQFPDGRIEAARPGAPRHLRYTGINFSGGEFNSGKIPGRLFKDYVYPDAQTVAPFADAGFTVARLPVRWERIQPAALGPLSKSEMDAVDGSLRALKPFRLTILDVHNYARYQGVLLSEGGNGAAMLADLWARLARRYANNPAVAFGLMNEPFGISAHDWRLMVDASIQAIRSTGARNLILVPGVRYTGAHSWLAGGEDSNANALTGIHDPASNYMIEMHQYLDSDSSGQHAGCVSPDQAAARLEAATLWLRKTHQIGFLGEFGTFPDESCLISMNALLDSMDRNADVWGGWTYWAAGKWWGNYPMSVQPNGDVQKPQYKILISHVSR